MAAASLTAYRKMRFLGASTLAADSVADLVHYWCCWTGRCPRVLLPGANYGDEVIPLSPTLLVCYVWLLKMATRCVLLPSMRKRLGKSKNTTS
jgi:hypothetical protein